jgi:phenylacetate-CoA ligase
VETDYLEIIVSEELSIENIQKIKNHLRAQLRVTPQIVTWNKKKLEEIIYNPNSRKPIRFLDMR